MTTIPSQPTAKPVSALWQRTPPATLRFSPYAWAKMLYLRDIGETEVGGFGISLPEDLLYVEDFQLIKQTCTIATVKLNDVAVADFFDRQVDAGHNPQEFARLWIHTHPGNSAQPSFTDEAVFERVFSKSDWAVMFVMAGGNQTHAQLRFNVGPGGEMKIPVAVDYSRTFAGSQQEIWRAEYLVNVMLELPVVHRLADFSGTGPISKVSDVKRLQSYKTQRDDELWLDEMEERWARDEGLEEEWHEFLCR